MKILSTISLKFYGYDRLVLDDVLTLFAECGIVERSVFFRGAPSDSYEKIEYLVSKGFLKENPRSLSITLAGRLYHKNGGFRKDLLRKVITYIVGIIGTLCGVISLILQLIA